MMKFKDEGVDGNVKGVEFLLKKNKIDAVHGTGPHRRARQGRGQGRRRQDADAGDQEHRHRHRLRRGAAQGRRDRRQAHRDVDQAHRARQGAAAAAGGRRRRDRARARLGVAAARRAGDGGRIPRPHPARHGQRGRPAVAAPPGKAGHRRSSSAPRSPASIRRARRSRPRSSRPRAARPRRSRPMSCWSRSAACPTPKGSASTRPASKKDNRGRVIVDAHFATNVQGHLRHRRRDRRADAGAQGRGRGHGGRRKSSPARPAT